MTQAMLLIMGLSTLAMVALALYWNNLITQFFVLAMLAFLANAVYFSLDGVKGWPSEEPTTVLGELASVVIVNPSSKGSGAIYIGVFLEKKPEWYEYKYIRYAPKTYFVEYSNNRAAQFEKAKQAMKEGQRVKITGIPPKESNGLEGEAFDGEDTGMFKYLGDAIQNLMSKTNKDTYKPVEPVLEIIPKGQPPEKGTAQ